MGPVGVGTRKRDVVVVVLVGFVAFLRPDAGGGGAILPMVRMVG